MNRGRLELFSADAGRLRLPVGRIRLADFIIITEVSVCLKIHTAPSKVFVTIKAGSSISHVIGSAPLFRT